MLSCLTLYFSTESTENENVCALRVKLDPKANMSVQGGR